MYSKRRNGGKKILKSGQEWTLPAKLGQLKTVGWLVGFGLNGPLRQYFSLYPG